MKFTNIFYLILTPVLVWIMPMQAQAAPGDITTVAGMSDPDSPYFAGLNSPSSSA